MPPRPTRTARDRFEALADAALVAVADAASLCGPRAARVLCDAAGPLAAAARAVVEGGAARGGPAPQPDPRPATAPRLRWRPSRAVVAALAARSAVRAAGAAARKLPSADPGALAGIEAAAAEVERAISLEGEEEDLSPVAAAALAGALLLAVALVAALLHEGGSSWE